MSGPPIASEALAEQVERAAAAVRARCPGAEPRIGLVLGSGLGPLADRVETPVAVGFDEIPGFPPAGVEGHAGLLVLGTLGDVDVAVLRGRAHLYEGHAAWRATLPVRTMVALGIETLFLSNAAGAVNRAFHPGDLMLIADHVDLQFRDPFPVGTPSCVGAPVTAWDPALRAVVREVAGREGIPLREGVYAALLGPSFETPAEIRALARLGVDAVGMSTVPEARTARSLGVGVFGVSCLTNYAAGIGGAPLDHEEVIETTERAAARFQALVLAAVSAIGTAREAPPSD